MRSTWLIGAALLIMLTGLAPAAARSTPPLRASEERTATALAQAPLMFVENVGQYDPGVRYVLDGGAISIGLAQDAIRLTMRAQRATAERLGSTVAEARVERGATITIGFVGANPAPRLEPSNQLDTHVSYFLGADPRGWHTSVPAWGNARYLELYPGIDLELSGTGGRLKPRLIARPGADLSSVRMRIEGAASIALSEDGVAFTTKVGDFTLPLPQVFAEGGGPLATPMRPELRGNQIIQPFASSAPNGSAPQAAGDLLYSTLFGGSGEDESAAIAVDGSGAAYIVGYSTSGNFPTNGLDISPSGYNATIVKVRPDGSGLEYVAVVGGDDIEYATGVAIDADGEAYVAGYTSSDDFPTTGGAYDTSGAGVDKLHREGFVFKLNSSATQLRYSTYLGGNDNERVTDIQVDANKAAYVTGRTPSANFPTTVGAFDTSFGGGEDGFVVKLDQFGSNLEYATLLGGNGNDRVSAIALDASGTAYLTGLTASTNFPTVSAYDSNPNGAEDAFVAKLNPAGTGLIYSTLLGGSGADQGLSVDIDTSGAAYIAGYTFSTDFPATVYDTSANGNKDGFAAKIGPSGTSLGYAAYFGGSDEDEGRGIAVNSAGEAYVAGFTKSSNFFAAAPPNSYDPSFNGGTDIFVVKLGAGGTPTYGSFLGGADLDSGDAIALDRGDAVYLSGVAGPTGFPAISGDTSFNGGPSDAFAAKLQIGAVQIPKYFISGTVLDDANAPVSGVSINACGRTTTTGTNGAYRIEGLPPNTCTIVPSRPGYQFDPPSRTVTLPGDQPEQNFRVVTRRFDVSGQVIDGVTAAGLAGVTISSSSGDTTTTGNDGGYRLRLGAGSYTLTASRSDYKFTPSSRQVTVVSADVGGMHFAGRLAIPPVYTAYSPLAVTRIVALCDQYEPNNNREQNPAPIKLGQTITALMCTKEGEPDTGRRLRDNYLVNTTKSGNLRIELALPTTLLGEISMLIFNSENLSTEINGCYKDEVTVTPFVFNCTVPATGSYIVELYSWRYDADNQRPYTLRVTQ
jgi:hypothetical protein